MRLTAIALGLLFSTQVASAATLHVPADYPTIQQAINASTSGDIVLVAAGTYHERITMGAAQSGVKVLSESGAAATIIDGGYTGSVVWISGVGSGTEFAGFTITHGGHSPPDFNDNGGGMNVGGPVMIDNNIVTGNSAGVGGGISAGGGTTITHNVIDSNASVEGVFFGFLGGGIAAGGTATITDNTITNNQRGGIYVEEATNVYIANNLIQGNTSFGMYWQGNTGAPGMIGTVENNRVISNVGPGLQTFIGGGPTGPITGPTIQGNLFQSNMGGGLLLSTSTTDVLNNQILGNTGAPGVRIDGAVATLQNNLIQDNENVNGPGGGIAISHPGLITIEQNVILRNHSAGGGGGIATNQGATATIRNNTVALNRSDQGGGNLYAVQGSALTLQRNIFSHSPNVGVQSDNSQGANTITMSCNDVSNNAGGNYLGMPDPTGTNGNIALDPLYCNLAALDVHIASSSPCAAANSPSGCGLIGALDVNCDGPVRTEPTTWGRMKARYR